MMFMASFVAVATLAAGVALAASALGASDRSAVAPREQPVQDAMTRDAALEKVKGLASEVPTTATLLAKLVTWSTIHDGVPDLQSVASLKDEQLLWAVSVEGGITPAFGHGEKYDWGLVLVDPTSGDVVGTLAGVGSSRAPYFDAAKDLSPSGE
jgi:hypothetical protein